MNRIIILISCLVGLFAFVAGRHSVSEKSPAETEASVESDSSHAAAAPGMISNAPHAGETAAAESAASAVAAVRRDNDSLPAVRATGPTTTVAGSIELNKATRRQLVEFLEARNRDVEKFRETDTRFNGRSRLNDADWKKLVAARKVSGTIVFDFEPNAKTEIDVNLGARSSQVKISSQFLPKNAATPDSFQSYSSSFDIRNGRGVGLSNDGTSYHLLIPNGVDDAAWAEFTDFAFSVPFEMMDGRTTEVEVFGLNEKLVWVPAGHANLRPIR